ncbi:MAG: T9SS type A sorting domain-containing protein [Paludibacteraceae bacterium]|nr:T9SS type A sorting domain-containing protein [Paludibacteraceae bacterium]
MKTTITSFRTAAFVVLFSVFSVAADAATITKTVGGAGADYATLGAAFAACTTADDYVLQITGSTNEGSTPAVLGNVDGRTVLIYPTVTGCVISGSYAGTDNKLALIAIQGADNVTFDGRLRNTQGDIIGSTPDLTIDNTSNATSARNSALLVGSIATAVPVARAAYDFTMRYCIVKSATQAPSNDNNDAGITLAPYANSNADDMRCLLEYNIFKASAAGRPIMTLMITTTNGVKVRNNKFEDVVKTDGIRVAYDNINCEISGNSFYETTAFEPTTAIIYINVTANTNAGSQNLKIENNYIGGSAAQCSGTMTKQNTGTTQNVKGIFLGGKLANGVSIKGNQIKNIEWITSSTSSVTFHGIHMNAGGGTSVPADANMNYIEGNFIGNINYSSTAKDHNLYGIYHENRIATIANNIISLGNTAQQTIYGIRTNALYTSATIKGDALIYYNTVYITGEQITANKPSYAFWSNTNTNTRDFRNNIFVNARIGNDSHYAAYLNYSAMVPDGNPNSVSFTNDYNDYYTTKVAFLCRAGVNYTTLATFQAATGQDAHSTDEDPGITAGTTPESFKGNKILAGVAIPGITTDYDGNTRTSANLGAFYLLRTDLIENSQNNLSQFRIVSNGILFDCNANAEVISISGKTVWKGAVNHQTVNLPKGVYIVKVTEGLQKQVAKVVLF